MRWRRPFCQDILRRRITRRPESATASNASEEGSGTVDATAVTVDEPTTTARLKKPAVTEKNIGALQIAVSVIGPIELFKSYVANATLAVSSISKPRVKSAKRPLAAEGGGLEGKR